MNTPWVVGVTRPREAQSGRPHPAGSESFTRREGAVLGQNQKFGESTTLINASAKSPTSVNALAGNGVDHPVPERMVWKPNPLIVGRLQMLSREEMSIQTRLTGQEPPNCWPIQSWLVCRTKGKRLLHYFRSLQKQYLIRQKRDSPIANGKKLMRGT